MQTVTINGAAIPDRETLHRVLAEKLSFPAWYGGNLDALYDCLTSLPEETELVILDWAVLQETLGSDAGKFSHVLRDAAMETSRLTVTMK